MSTDEQIKAAEGFARMRVSGFDSGHDWWHVQRVRNMSLFINEKEKIADPFLLNIAALLHDVTDSKFPQAGSENSYEAIADFLNGTGLGTFYDRLAEVIRNVSFSNKTPAGNLSDPLLLIIQDADRLDAIGAIGIARAFNYGGFRNRPIFDPDETGSPGVLSTISHFYDKLLKLKEMMNTTTGRKLAEERHLFLETYLEQFYREWQFAFQ